jgi:hypothetical protein
MNHLLLSVCRSLCKLRARRYSLKSVDTLMEEYCQELNAIKERT